MQQTQPLFFIFVAYLANPHHPAQSLEPAALFIGYWHSGLLGPYSLPPFSIVMAFRVRGGIGVVFFYLLYFISLHLDTRTHDYYTTSKAIALFYVFIYVQKKNAIVFQAFFPELSILKKSLYVLIQYPCVYKCIDTFTFFLVHYNQSVFVLYSLYRHLFQTCKYIIYKLTTNGCFLWSIVI